MIRAISALLLSLVLGVAIVAAAQQETEQPKTPEDTIQPDDPVANPGRPTVSTPATLTPVGYLQFETGVLGAWMSPEVSSQTNLNEVVKFAVAPRVEFLAGFEPVAHSRVGQLSRNDAGGISLGV